MNVTTDVQRSDLLKMQLYMLPRLKANWIVFLVLALALFVWALYALPGPLSLEKVLIGAAAGVGGAFAGLVVGTLCSLAFIHASSTARAGVLGEHRFEIRPEGLFEQTHANEQLCRWSGILAVEKTRSFILVRINGYLFHVIPSRGFRDRGEYDRFFEELQSKWRAAAA